MNMTRDVDLVLLFAVLCLIGNAVALIVVLVIMLVG
jgi:hypothetical protein